MEGGIEGVEDTLLEIGGQAERGKSETGCVCWGELEAKSIGWGRGGCTCRNRCLGVVGIS